MAPTGTVTDWHQQCHCYKVFTENSQQTRPST